MPNELTYFGGLVSQRTDTREFRLVKIELISVVHGIAGGVSPTFPTKNKEPRDHPPKGGSNDIYLQT